MINIGDFNKLKVKRKTNIGYYLGNDDTDTTEDILLPNASLNGTEVNEGDEIEAFIYRDSEDRVIATLKKPLSKVGELAYLKVISSTKIGSFIDFGLEKDILVPFKEKVYPLQNGKSYLFYIYLDKSGRIAATTYIDKHLKVSGHEYKVGDMVSGVVYGFQSNDNIMVAVDNSYKGLILHNEYFNEIKCGELLELRVNKIYEGGKLGLTPRKTMKEESDELQEKILEYLKDNDGFMKFNDKSSPEEIRDKFQVSKKQFKNSLGGLMKKGLISQEESGTRLN